jgi:hypothetical protein
LVSEAHLAGASNIAILRSEYLIPLPACFDLDQPVQGAPSVPDVDIVPFQNVWIESRIDLD